jgi:hypothetical protein
LYHLSFLFYPYPLFFFNRFRKERKRKGKERKGKEIIYIEFGMGVGIKDLGEMVQTG